jgi:orotate phosphoribosyltransferase
MVAIFTYQFPVAQQQFEAAGVRLITLSNYNAVLEEAAAVGYIRPEELATLAEWRKDPAAWNPAN